MNWLLVCWNYQMWNLWLRTAAVLPNQSWQGQEQWLSQWQAGDITCTVKIPLMPNPGLQSAKVALISSSIYRTDGLQGLRFTAWCSTAHYKTHLKEKAFSSLCLTFFFHLHEAHSKPSPTTAVPAADTPTHTGMCLSSSSTKVRKRGC